MTGHDRTAVRARIRRWFGRKPLIRHAGRRRTMLFLGVNLLAYAFATAFLHYLGTGHWVNLSLSQFTSSAGRLPSEVLLSGPLEIFSYPWMIVIVGLLLGVVIMVPLMVACLYHSRYCALFLPCTFLLAAAPVLTILLAAGCMLVAATTLRSHTPMLALLLGMAPVAAYLYLSGSHVSPALQSMQWLVLYVPFVLAGLTAVLGGAVVLVIAWATRYRPGVIWPVLAVLLSVPAWLFHRQIGADELGYALLMQQLTPAEGLFADEALQPWLHRHAPPAAWSEPRSVIEPDLARRKDRITRQCEQFLQRWPDSRRRAAVLWLQGLAQDTQLDARALSQGLLRCYDGFPLPDSRTTWQRLAREHPTDVRAGVANLRLARLAIREGHLLQAAELLALAEQVLPAPPAAVTPASAPASTGMELTALFKGRAAPPSPAYLQRVAQDVRTLRWLLGANRLLEDSDAARSAVQAFAAEAAIDPNQMSRHEFAQRIARLSRRHPDDYWSDNLALTTAMNNPDPAERARALLGLLDARHPDGRPADAAVTACYELGRLALQGRVRAELNGQLQEPRAYFEMVCQSDNPWQRLVEQHLLNLATQEARP